MSYNEKIYKDGYVAGKQEKTTGIVPCTSGFKLAGTDGELWWKGYNDGLSGKRPMF